MEKAILSAGGNHPGIGFLRRVTRRVAAERGRDQLLVPVMGRAGIFPDRRREVRNIMKPLSTQ